MQIETPTNRFIMKSTATRTLSLATIIALALGTLSIQSSQAYDCHQLVRLAHQLDAQLESLRENLANQFKHTPQYDQILEDVRAMRRSAEHIDQLSHNSYEPIQHLEADVVAIDQLSHQLHDLVDRTERSGRGHIHGKTKRTHELLASVTATIHAMTEQIAIMKRPVRHSRGQFSQNYGVPHARSPQYAQPYRPQYAPQTFNGYAQQNYNSQAGFSQPGCNQSAPAYASQDPRAYANSGLWNRR